MLDFMTKVGDIGGPCEDKGRSWGRTGFEFAFPACRLPAKCEGLESSFMVRLQATHVQVGSIVN